MDSESVFQSQLDRLLGTLGVKPRPMEGPRVIEPPDPSDLQACLPPGRSLWMDSGGTYHSVYGDLDRGTQSDHITSKEALDVLFPIAFNYILCEASSYEREHREARADKRRAYFAYMQRRMEELGPEYANRCRAEISSILRSSPYDDATYVEHGIW